MEVYFTWKAESSGELERIQYRQAVDRSFVLHILAQKYVATRK
jgi:hypothetical protein